MPIKAEPRLTSRKLSLLSFETLIDPTGEIQRKLSHLFLRHRRYTPGSAQPFVICF